MPEKLSEVAARKTLPPVRGQTILWDGDVKGFALRITPGGAKSFILDYRAEGRQRRITIGACTRQPHRGGAAQGLQPVDPLEMA